MRWISYYIRNRSPKKSDRNDWAIMILVDSTNWPERNRVHRGCTKDRLAFRRNMQPHEIEASEARPRLEWRRYSSWQDLIEDEARILGSEDHPFLDVLREESKKPEYCLIPFHSVGEQAELF